MIRKRRWLWVVLFVWVALLLGILATGWNVVLVRDYERMLLLAKTIALPGELSLPWGSLILGTLGFVAALATLILFFLKILKEMRLNQIQSQFLATVSHELKTPIAAIELTSSLIRGGGLSSDEIARLWESHQAELRRLREDVELLLEAARWQSRSITLQRARVPLEAWINESIARWRRLLGPGASLVRDGGPIESTAFVDPRTFNLIADNLLDNARKFSRGHPEVVIRARRLPASTAWPWARPRWRIEFTDQGWGFDPSDRKRIFTRFFRARTDAPYAIPGTGLGLYLASSAGEAMGIRLRGESPGKGRGATFTIEGVDVG